MIVFDCPSCRAELEAELELAGETIECPSCGHAMLIPAGAIARGSRIAGYEIERHLGGGTLGEVYVATQLSVERRVALKILPPALARHATLTAAFLREARALARVNHPGVVAVLDAGADSGCFYLAAPLVEGEDLARRMERQGRLSEAEAVHVALEIARVLADCWDRFAAAHLDLKPANVLVDTEGRVHLLDLGLTGHLFSDPDNLPLVRNLLASSYVSPEQAAGHAALDFRCDLYALGATLYHLATGRHPYPETVADELINRIMNQQLPSAREANPGLSAPFDQLIADLTVKDVQRRPASWGQVIETLQGMDRAGAAPAPPRPSGIRRHQVAKPSAAPAPPHVIKLKQGHHLPHHPVAATGPSATPWIIGVLLLLGVLGGVFGLKAMRHRTEMEAQLAASEAAARTGQEEEKRVRAAAMVRSARQYLDAYPKDIEGGRGQIRAAREQLLGTPFAAALAPELDALDAVLAERARPAPVEPAAPPSAEVAADPPAEPDTVAPETKDAAPKSSAMASLYQAAGRLLERDFAGAGAQLPAQPASVEGIDVGVLRKELAELPRWVDWVHDGLRESIGKEQDFDFRDGKRALIIRSVSATQIRAEKVARDGDRVIGRSASTFRLEDLSADELIRQLHGERGGVSAVMCGLVAYRAGRLGDARSWFNRTTSPWAPLLIRAMDEASTPPP